MLKRSSYGREMEDERGRGEEDSPSRPVSAAVLAGEGAPCLRCQSSERDKEERTAPVFGSLTVPSRPANEEGAPCPA